MTDQPFTFARAFRRHMHDSIRHYGWRRTIWEIWLAWYRLFRDMLPDRRQSRCGDLDYDVDHSVNTTRATVSLRTQFTTALAGHQYFASEPWLFQEIMQALPIRFEDFIFIDLGSGKGRALLMASDWPFQRIIGAEFIPELNAIAEQNIAEYSSETQKCKNLESHCLDAREFEFPSGPVVLYLFNPFPEPVFAQVIRKLKQSCEQDPRPVLVAYRYREYEHLLQEGDWLENIAEAPQWVIYSSRDNRLQSS